MDRVDAVRRIKVIQKLYVFTPTINGALDLAIEALKGDLHCPKCGTIVRDGRQYHDLVYRGEAEKHQLSGETSTISEETSTNSNKNSKDNLSFSKSVKLINPCNSLLKPDSDERKEQKSKLDCISRADAIAYIDRITNSGLGRNKSLDYIRKYISALPSVNQKQITGKLENAETATSEGEESTMDQPKSKLDLISRAKAIAAVRSATVWRRSLGRGDILDILYSTPPVTPTERTGEWDNNFKCSNCGSVLEDIHVIDARNGEAFNFCPVCGADMRGDKE